MSCEKPNAGKSGQVSMRAYPKEVYDWYKSASLHTGKRKLPKQLWIFLTCMLVIPVLIYFVWQHFLNMGKVATDPAAKPGDAAYVAAPGGAPVSKHMTISEYLDTRKPRIDDLPHTAPMYDEVTKPVTAPYPAACVQDAKRCLCYTQQGTLMRTSGETCQQIVKYGYFMEWDDGRNRHGAAQPAIQKQQQQQQPSYRPQPVYEPAPELVGFEERMAARNATVVSSLKR